MVNYSVVCMPLPSSCFRVHGVCVCDDADYFYSEADGYLKGFGLTETPDGTPLKSSDMMDLIDGFKGEGYAMSTDEELSMLIIMSSNV